MIGNFAGKAAPLSPKAFDETRNKLDIDDASLWSLLTVETRGFGFLQDRRPKILYERHIFHKRTAGRFSEANPDISSATSGGYEGGAAEYSRLERAMRLDRRAALESVSWGLGQIMGFNAVSLRYAGVEEMITKFLESEDAQLEGVSRFISNNASLGSAFRSKNWKQVAFFYNGAEFAKNAYHTKLEHYHDLYAIEGPPSIEVRAAQARLTYLGFDPRGVDGLLGDGTHTALLAFQKARGIPRTAELDETTREALGAAGNV